MNVPAAGVLALRIISHNIRYAANPPSANEAPWSERLPDLLAQFRYHTQYAPQTFLCLQEVLDGQLNDILSGLNADGEEWLHIGVGRDDGAKAGEYSPILYRPSVWELKKCDHFWLSEHPARPTRGWDAGSIRIVTIGEFQNRKSKRNIVAFNTHLDNAGTIARAKGAELVLERIRSYLENDASMGEVAVPVFLAGDMNSNEEQEAYGVFTGPTSPLVDVKEVVPAGHVYGYNETFTGFNGGGEGRIDYVFASHKLKPDWTGDSYATLPNLFEDGSGIRFSDHRAVVVDLQLHLS